MGGSRAKGVKLIAVRVVGWGQEDSGQGSPGWASSKRMTVPEA